MWNPVSSCKTIKLESPLQTPAGGAGNTHDI